MSIEPIRSVLANMVNLQTTCLLEPLLQRATWLSASVQPMMVVLKPQLEAYFHYDVTVLAMSMLLGGSLQHDLLTSWLMLLQLAQSQ
jgi:hypothetical protein